MAERKFYHLAAGQVGFIRPGSDTVEAMVSNTLVITADNRITAQHIARLQRTFQMNLQKRLPDILPNVVDVVILSLVPLGEFAEGEFEAGSILENMQKPDSEQAIQ